MQLLRRRNCFALAPGYIPFGLIIMKLSLRVRLLLSFVGVVVISTALTSFLAFRVIHRTLPQVQDVVAVDLSAAREIYRQSFARVSEVVRRNARQSLVRTYIEKGDINSLQSSLEAIRDSQHLDILTLTNVDGSILLRVGNPPEKAPATPLTVLTAEIAAKKTDVSSAMVFPGKELALEGKDLADRARIDAVSTAYADFETSHDVSAGLVLMAGAPVMAGDGHILAVLCGGELLNRQTAMVDSIRSSLYRDEKYDGKDVAVLSIFLGDKRIATSATSISGQHAVGTLVSKDVYERVVLKGGSWVDRGYVINDWYLTAYEPIRDLKGRVIGILGLGLLERKFSESEQHALRIFLLLSAAAIVLAGLVSYWLLNSVMRPVKALIAGTEKVAAGGSLQDLKIDHSPPEIDVLVKAFNRMQGAIRERRRQTQEKLMRSDRLAMIGQLAAGVAHEINNPLASILLFSRLVAQQVPLDGRAKENLDRIEKETKRCHSIVQSLLDFSRQREPSVESVNINGLLDSTLKLFEGQHLFHNMHVVKNYTPDLDTIQADPSQLQQVFMNVILNAVDAMKGKGELTLETGNGAEDGCIEIRISDTGCGISAENITRIFDPFFTTKGVGHGTGLGLSVSYGIIQRHGGDISVSSAPEAGSIFTITLPRIRENT
jgi:two-component system, NtrC family, sensor kinase